MVKHLVETSGAFELVDFTYNQQIVDAFRPSVVEMSIFLSGRVANGQVRILGKLSENATDEEFLGFWRESKTPEQAIDSFLSAFGLQEVTEKTVKAPAAKKAKA
ncbi:hypothetical protein [Palleronia sp.]|uniref:hypothetical protein n=1 Tax=Palleronia sp. TaxID=1940284 RepID=UPI0035C7A0AA